MKKPVLGIDIGGTKIFHALVNEQGEIISEIKKEETPKNSSEIEQKLKNIILSYENKVEIAGIATAGAVNNTNDGILGSTGNLPAKYAEINFKKLHDKIKIFIENDANAAAWAEYKTGAAKGLKNAIILTLGTGVGGGIIVNGALLKGKSGAAGEMHFKMSVDNKRQCSCNSSDCFEIYASGRGLQLTYKDITGDEISTYEIIQKYNENDKNAVLSLQKWNEYIAIGALGLNNIFDTEIIAFTGSMAQFADFDFIEEYVNKYTITTKTKIAPCKAGNYAGITGAALLAAEKAE